MKYTKIEFKDKEFLHQKYIVENMTCKKIAELTNIPARTIHLWLTKFNIPRRKGGVRFWSEDQKEYRRQWNINHPEVSRMKGKTHSLETRIKMSHQRQGFLNGNWKNGITARVRKLRTTKEYLQWKKLVIDRAKGVCQKCGDSTELYAHHIISIFKDITLATNPNNGLAVCVKCHRRIHMSLNKTRIEWVINLDRTPGYTWNPITGCLHGCSYCYAKRITDRFAGQPFKTKFIENCAVEQVVDGKAEDVLLEYRPDFTSPTFWSARLEDPFGVKNPSTFFVCSMADMFGPWVPSVWIERILNIVKQCPQHTFLFLTKNGSRMCSEGEVVDTENAWYGQTCTGVPDRPIVDINYERQFLSFEPLLGDWVPDLNWIHTNWVIIGSLNRNGKAVHPNKGGTRKEWVLKVIEKAEAANKPIYIKSELLRLYPDLPQKKDIPYLKR